MADLKTETKTVTTVTTVTLTLTWDEARALFYTIPGRWHEADSFYWDYLRGNVGPDEFEKFRRLACEIESKLEVVDV